MELHPCGCIFPLSHEIIEAVTSGKLEAIGGAGGAEIPGSIQGFGETRFPERVPGALSAPLISASGELTGSDISGVTRLSCTNWVFHPKQGERAGSWVASRSLRKEQSHTNEERGNQAERIPNGLEGQTDLDLSSSADL